MKKYIFRYFLLLLGVVVLASCKEDEGTEPGGDSSPVVTIYQYEASLPYNVDNDVVLRIAANSATTSAYYLAELTSEQEARVESLGESGYRDYVVTNGTQLSEISGSSTADLVLTDLYGEYTITVVAVGGSSSSSASVTFTGLDWSDVATGSYYFYAVTRLGLSTTTTTLQVCTTDATLYRFKDLFGSGYSMKINLLTDYTATDSNGDTYTYFRIPETVTSYTYGSYGTVSVRDVGYWQGNDAYVTSYGYESGMYEDYYCFLMIQYYVSAGNLGYGYDYFVPAE
ncbi:MAG: hypothetical protein Q4D56_06420 [Bacteroides sp.]|nr:hypothetical protein [Bacteroides sp.]